MPCPKCQSTGAEEWPPRNVSELATFVESLDRASPHYSSVSAVFTCALLENLLESQVYMMAMMDMGYNDVGLLTDLLMEAHQGRTRLLQLYRRVGYRSFTEDASRAGCPNFPANWETIAKARNQVLHGRPNAAEDITYSLITNVISNALQVFALAHNEYNSESHRYKAAAGDPEALQADQERLEKWRRAVGHLPEDNGS